MLCAFFCYDRRAECQRKPQATFFPLSVPRAVTSISTAPFVEYVVQSVNVFLVSLTFESALGCRPCTESGIICGRTFSRSIELTCWHILQTLTLYPAPQTHQLHADWIAGLTPGAPSRKPAIGRAPVPLAPFSSRPRFGHKPVCIHPRVCSTTKVSASPSNMQP